MQLVGKRITVYVSDFPAQLPLMLECELGSSARLESFEARAVFFFFLLLFFFFFFFKSLPKIFHGYPTFLPYFVE